MNTADSKTFEASLTAREIGGTGAPRFHYIRVQAPQNSKAVGELVRAAAVARGLECINVSGWNEVTPVNAAADLVIVGVMNDGTGEVRRAVEFPNGTIVSRNAHGEKLTEAQARALEYYARCQRDFAKARAAWTALNSFSYEGRLAQAAYRTASTGMSNAHEYAVEIGAISRAYWG